MSYWIHMHVERSLWLSIGCQHCNSNLLVEYFSYSSSSLFLARLGRSFVLWHLLLFPIVQSFTPFSIIFHRISITTYHHIWYELWTLSIQHIDIVRLANIFRLWSITFVAFHIGSRSHPNSPCLRNHNKIMLQFHREFVGVYDVFAVVCMMCLLLCAWLYYLRLEWHSQSLLKATRIIGLYYMCVCVYNICKSWHSKPIRFKFSFNACTRCVLRPKITTNRQIEREEEEETEKHRERKEQNREQNQNIRHKKKKDI